METVRIDKYLWAVRLFKTRSEAADACKNNRVKVNGIEAKPSRDLKAGDLITIRKMPVIYSYKILALIENRQPAKNVPLYIENITPEEELAKLEKRNIGVFVQRDPGTGRPTKKDRRDIDRLFEDMEDELDD